MIESSTVLALIPARGGSKGVPRKNIRDVAGKPLIAWTIEAARRSRFIDRTVLSSEDVEIIETARLYGCEAPFCRPAHLATDEADSISVILHAIASLQSTHDYVVLLQPTSPLRSAEDIDGAIRQCHERRAPSCVSVSRVDKSPHWMFTLGSDGSLNPYLGAERIPARRQDSGPIFALNGAVYVARRAVLERTKSFLADRTIGYEMPRERSLDIDDELDLRIAGLLMSNTLRSSGS